MCSFFLTWGLLVTAELELTPLWLHSSHTKIPTCLPCSSPLHSLAPRGKLLRVHRSVRNTSSSPDHYSGDFGFLLSCFPTTWREQRSLPKKPCQKWLFPRCPSWISVKQPVQVTDYSVSKQAGAQRGHEEDKNIKENVYAYLLLSLVGHDNVCTKR